MIEYHSAEPYYLALKLARASSLLGFITILEGNIRNERWTRYFFRQIVEGLAFMHSQSIVHLDMKIDNILLDFNDEGTSFNATIADFGRA